ncbi:aldehyde dehydrogenase family protein [Streptomyces sp. UG1]|uniref:aldehyde dehydrogenase family protein n=1 Tax=Streptomyces sp. UG1 TaxID=3417652 RepID=UPI003CED13E3
MSEFRVDRILVDGSWRTPSGPEIRILNPATEEPALTLVDASREDVDAAVAAARTAFDHSPWRWLSHQERADLLAPAAEELKKRWAAEMAPAFTSVCGTPTTVAQAFSAGALGIFTDVANTAAKFQAEEKIVGVGGRAGKGHPATVVHEPAGVVAAIAPWNGQLYLTLTKLLPALVAGCTVVAKPSPETSVEAVVLAEALKSTGVPDGVVNILPGGREAGQRLVAHPDVDMVAFTGSTAAGKAIMATVSERLARLSLELGGKSSGIVLDDVDTATVARQLLSGTALMTGQACALLSRILVPRARLRELGDAFAEAIGSVPFGDPADPKNLMGPLVSKAGMEHAIDLIESAKKEGATLLRGGGRPAGHDRGWFVEPTVFTDVHNEMRLARDEVFGPVYAFIPYDTEEEAIRIANDSAFGLAGAAFSADEERAEWVVRRLRAGATSINGFGLDPGVPFGGFKQSGIGREGGVEGLRMFTEVKAIHHVNAKR